MAEFPLENSDVGTEGKPKVVVVMGATGAGKSRLAIDLASFFTVEIINADSMQVYEGLDVLTNKVLLEDRRGVPHHLLGTVSANVDFTSKDFRDQAIPIVGDILSRRNLPIIVGGTNYYIQALVSPFLVDDLIDDTEIEDRDGYNRDGPPGVQRPKFCFEHVSESTDAFDHLKKLDPVAANRIHPNDHRKVNHYISLYEGSGVLPSKLFQGKASEKWGRTANFRYDCCFIWVDASLTVLDKYVDQRVDSMMDAGLLAEVHDIYNPNAAYTRGLRQAIGVREFEEFFKYYYSKAKFCLPDNSENVSGFSGESWISLTDVRAILESNDNNLKILLNEAIAKLKANTRRLVRRQKRRLNRLKTFFGWNLHCIDATEAFLGEADDSWTMQVVEPCVKIINSFLHNGSILEMGSHTLSNTDSQRLDPRDLWTQYICEACGNRVLRGAHEWEQHKQGRAHRKRVLHLKKSQSSLMDQRNHLFSAD